MERLSLAPGFIEPKEEKRRTRMGSLPLNECREETARLFL